ncbi:MAG: Ig-like domain-containing protein [Candidatus Thorarchaeota archaeon]|nr:Ig-like domain-containing protein [Candidatus Thorarchaeota archaeon]
MSGDAYDTYSSIVSSAIYIDGEYIDSLTIGANGWTYELDTSELDDGYHVFHFTITDKVGYTKKIYTFLIIENNELVKPFIPVVDHYGNYITYCRTTIGDSQLTIAATFPEIGYDTTFSMLISPKYLECWDVIDAVYANDQDGTTSFYTHDSFHVGTYSIQFESYVGIDLSTKSIVIHANLMPVSWSLASGTDYSVVFGEDHQISFSLSDLSGQIPIGLPYDVALYAIQSESMVLLSTSYISASGIATFSFRIDETSGLSNGPFTLQVEIINLVQALYDKTTMVSGEFDSFMLYEKVAWTFTPNDGIIVHYSPTIYDQRQLTVYIALSNSLGSESAMIGQAINVYLTGEGLDVATTIFQTEHTDGIHALFTYDLTNSGTYALTFDYLPYGYYLDLPSKSIDVVLEDLRPVEFDITSPDEIVAGSSIVLTATITDAWASDFPIAYASILFGYIVDGIFVPLGESTSDGFGIAQFTWDPSELEWLNIGRKELTFVAEFASTNTYEGSSDSILSSINNIYTYFTYPLASPESIDAGQWISVNASLYNQFGTALNESIDLTIEDAYGHMQTYSFTSSPDDTLDIQLLAWGDYIITLHYPGNLSHSECIATQSISVRGLLTFIDIITSPEIGSIKAGENLLISISLTDLESNTLDGVSILVSITWLNITSDSIVVIGLNDTISFTPEITGYMDIEVVFLGDSVYESSANGLLIHVDRRPTILTLNEIPSIVYPSIDPSSVEYSMIANVVDAVSNNPIGGATVLFCYVAENSTIMLPVYNGTGYFNESLVSEYLAWGLFHSIGTSVTNSNGVAEVFWAVDVIPEQFLTVFCITLQTELHATGISNVWITEFERILTISDVEAMWSGSERDVEIDIGLCDIFGYRLYGKQVSFEIQGIAGMTNFLFVSKVTIGVNDSFTWTASDYGAYEIRVWFDGDEIYQESGVAEDLFVVSWRLLDLTLETCDTTYLNDVVTLTANLVDVNATDEATLLENVTVYFAHYIDGTKVDVGSSVSNSNNYAVFQWEINLPIGSYYVFAYTKRQLMYEASLSNFAELIVRPLETYLSVYVSNDIHGCFNFSYTFDIDLVDEFGNELIGELVTLTLTDNYTDFWQINFDDHAYVDCCDGLQSGNPRYHKFVFSVIIGHNDTFTWFTPGRVSDRILFAARSIAIAEYSGTLSYSPDMTTKKLSCCLIETNINIIIENNQFTNLAGVPQNLIVNVTDEFGNILYSGLVNVTIIGPDGSVRNYQIDLEQNNTILWTPEVTGYHIIKAQYLGGTRSNNYNHYNHHHTCHHRWRQRIIYQMSLTRSFESTGVLVISRDVEISFEQIAYSLESGTNLLLRAYAFDSLSNKPLNGYQVTFYFLDSQGRMFIIGTGTTNAYGLAEILWTTPEVTAQSYEVSNIFVEGNSLISTSLLRYDNYPRKIWPIVEEDQGYNPASIDSSVVSTRQVDDISGIMVLTFVICMIALPMQMIGKLNPNLLRILALALLFFCMTSTLYIVLGIESMTHPFDDTLVADIWTNPSGVTASGETMQEAQSAIKPAARSYDTYNQGTSSFFISEEPTLPLGAVATTTPNATYIVVALRKSLDVGFAAQGMYVVTVLDEHRNPIDTAAGQTDGPVTVTFQISPEKYTPGERYIVNVFVYNVRGGIVYGDTYYIVMLVSRTATYSDLILMDGILELESSTVEIPLIAKLTRMHENMTIAGAEMNFYARPAETMEWQEIGTAITDQRGIATINWDTTLSKGSYIINATYYGDSNHDLSTSAKVIEVKGIKTVLNFAEDQKTHYTTQYGHEFTAYASLSDCFGTPLANKVVKYSIQVGSNRYWVGQNSTNSDGLVRFSYSPFISEGVYDLIATFEGDDTHSSYVLIYPNGLDVHPQTCLFGSELDINAISGRSVSISVPITDDRGLPLVSWPVIYEIYNPLDESWSTFADIFTDLSGYASTEYVVNVSPGTYAVRLQIIGDETTQQTALQGTLHVHTQDTDITIIPVNGYFGETLTLSSHLEDDQHHPISDKTLLFYIKIGDTWEPIGSAMTNSLGWANLDLSLNYPEGDYEIKAIFPGDQYHSSSECISIGAAIQKSPSVIMLSIPETAHITLPIQLNMTLYDISSTPLPGRTIHLTIGPESGESTIVTIRTDKTGSVTYVYVPSYLGEYQITAEFLGDEGHNNIVASGSFEAEKIELAISLVLSKTTGYRGDRIDFSGIASTQVEGENPKPADSGITFKMTLKEQPSFNIGEYELVTKANGILEGSWTIPVWSEHFLAGDYTFLIEVLGGTIFQGNTEFDFRIKLTTEIVINPIYPIVDGTQLDSSFVDLPMNFDFQLLDQDRNPLIGYQAYKRVNDDVWMSCVTDSAGQWTEHEYTPNIAGGLAIFARFDGTDFFDSIESSLELQISRRMVSLQVELSDTYVHRGDDIELYITANDLIFEDLSIYDTIEVDIYVDGNLIEEISMNSKSITYSITMPSYLKAGTHKVTIQSRTSRVYESASTIELLDAFVKTQIDIDNPAYPKTGVDTQIQLTLMDEDSIPLGEKHLTLDIVNPDGIIQSIFVKTDSAGRVIHKWTPNSEGDYSISGTFYGEHWFDDETTSNQPDTVTVESGTAATEGGPAPLWLLPLLLCVVANCVLQGLTYGLLSFIDVTLPVDEGSMRFYRYSYPWVEIHDVQIGALIVPIPVIVIKSDFQVELIQSGDRILFMQGGSEGQSADFYDNSLADAAEVGLGALQNTHSTPVLKQPSTTFSPFVAPYIPADDSLPSSQPNEVEITSHNNGSLVGGIIDVKCQVTNPESVSKVTWYLDGGVAEEESIIGGNNYEYNWQSDIIELLLFPQFSNGPHTVRVVVENKDGTSDESMVILNLNNFSTIMSGILLIVAAVLVTVILEIYLDRRFFSVDPTTNSILNAIKGAVCTVAPTFAVLFILDYFIYPTYGHGVLSTPIAQFGTSQFYFGYALAAIFGVIGGAIAIAGFYKADQSSGTLLALLIANVILTLGATLIGEFLGGGSLGFAAETLLSVIFTAGIARVILSLITKDDQSKVKDDYGMVAQAVAIGCIAAGLYLLLRTESEVRTVW